MKKRRAPITTPVWTPEAIKALRERLGLTQAEAAKRVEASRRSWFYWEKGEQVPDRCHLRLLTLLDQEKI